MPDSVLEVNRRDHISWRLAIVSLPFTHSPRAAEWAIPALRADEGGDCGAAEIQRIAENALPAHCPAVQGSDSTKAMTRSARFSPGASHGRD
jgi:hypothetical protein